MNKKKETGMPAEDLRAMSDAQRDAIKADLEKQRMNTVRGIEELLCDISKKRKGKSLRMKNPKKLGTRPNDTVEK